MILSKVTSKIFPFNQQKFEISNQNKETRQQLGGEIANEQQSKAIAGSIHSSKYGLHT